MKTSIQRAYSNGSITVCTPCSGQMNEIRMPSVVSNGTGSQSRWHSGQVL